MQQHLKEPVEHRSSLFPFQEYQTPNLFGAFSVYLHWHPELEIILIEEGNVTVEVDGATILLLEEDIVFVDPGKLHSLNGDGEKGRYSALVFPLKALLFEAFDTCQKEFLLPLSKGQMLFPTHLSKGMPGWEDCRSLLQHVFRLFQDQTAGYQLQIRGLLLQLIGVLAEHQHFVIKPQNDTDELQERLRQILQYINEHCDQQISLSRISKHFGFSPKYFCRFFRLHFGRTFIEYLTHARLQKAAYLLTHTDMKVLAVAMSCGYDNMSYFIRRFTQQFSKSPTSYRKAMLASGTKRESIT